MHSGILKILNRTLLATCILTHGYMREWSEGWCAVGGVFFCLSSVYFHSYFMMWTFGSGISPTHSNSSVGGREAHDEAMIIATAKLLLYSGFLNSNKPLTQPGTQMFTMYALGYWRSLPEELRCAPTLTSSKGRQNLFSPPKSCFEWLLATRGQYYIYICKYN